MALAACTATIDHRGNLPDPFVLQEIQPGATSRDEVATMLGSPSSVAAFGEETWYYISTETERLAFYEPEVLDQQVVAIAFDSAGVVKSIRQYGPEDAREIDLVDRKTRTGGRKLTFIQQLIGNLGRFTGKDPVE
ncbi:MAG: outer membrane protein assembly factor BamE [Proteobacteria bacterium]|nr:outer membrane protein assembly factor BamE [Pseudomonadota bacterium]